MNNTARERDGNSQYVPGSIVYLAYRIAAIKKLSVTLFTSGKCDDRVRRAADKRRAMFDVEPAANIGTTTKFDTNQVGKRRAVTVSISARAHDRYRSPSIYRRSIRIFVYGRHKWSIKVIRVSPPKYRALSTSANMYVIRHSSVLIFGFIYRQVYSPMSDSGCLT